MNDDRGDKTNKITNKKDKDEDPNFLFNMQHTEEVLDKSRIQGSEYALGLKHVKDKVNFLVNSAQDTYRIETLELSNQCSQTYGVKLQHSKLDIISKVA